MAAPAAGGGRDEQLIQLAGRKLLHQPPSGSWRTHSPREGKGAVRRRTLVTDLRRTPLGRALPANSLLDEVRRLGRDGWELVGVLPLLESESRGTLRTTVAHALLKRPPAVAGERTKEREA